MEKISYSVDLISLLCLCFYSPCHSQVENFLFHDNKQKVHRSQSSKAGSLQFEGFPLFNGTGEERKIRGGSCERSSAKSSGRAGRAYLIGVLERCYRHLVQTKHGTAVLNKSRSSGFTKESTLLPFLSGIRVLPGTGNPTHSASQVWKEARPLQHSSGQGQLPQSAPAPTAEPSLPGGPNLPRWPQPPQMTHTSPPQRSSPSPRRPSGSAPLPSTPRGRCPSCPAPRGAPRCSATPGAGSPGRAPLPQPRSPARWDAAHRHQELQRAHIVPLGLEQLVEDADAEAKLLLQVLAALPLAFPSALLRHGARRGGALPAAPLRRERPGAADKDNKRARWVT